MAQIQKLQGIVIKKIDYKENANLITLLTKEGKISLIVRGSKKINSVTRNYTNLFTKMNFNSTNNLKLNTLTEASILKSYVNINNDLDKMNIGLIILEKINKLTDEISNQELLYDFVSLIFDKLEETNFPNTLLSLFEVKLLYLLGVSPEFKECTICSKKQEEHNVFSAHNGGIICSSHLINNYDLNENETKALELLFFIKPDKVDDEFLSLVNEYNSNISNTLDKFYEIHLEFYSKAKKIIKELQK